VYNLSNWIIIVSTVRNIRVSVHIRYEVTMTSENRVSFMLNEKGKDLLVLNDFKFFKHHTSKKNENTWPCVINKCKAKVYTVKLNVKLINIDK